MTDTKKNTLTILAVVLTIAVIFSACTSIFTAKAVYDLRAEAKAQTETQEDGVVILDQYEIVSTLPISEAYRSGNTNGLSAKDKETLELASAVLKEIITEDMTPYEKEKAVYDWMAKELSYDTGALQVVPQTSADCDNPYGTLKYHNAVCVGYATTFRLFMQMLDIPCMVVHNTERYHSWNLVQIEGNWYHVDIYSDQGVGSYANFNMNDELAAVSHDWDWDFFPAATSLEYNYAYQNRVSVKDIYQIPAMIRQAMEEKQGGLFLDFPSLDENGAQIVEAMISGVETALAESPEGPALWMHWSWMPISGSEYVLGLSIEGYDAEEAPEATISEEDQQKVEQAVNDAFGANLDWESIQAGMDDGGGSGESSEFLTDSAEELLP